MIRLLRLVHLPFWERHPGQALLPVLGIALGVAAIVAIDLGSGSTVSSFRRTVQRLEGRTTHQVHPGSASLRGETAIALQAIEGIAAAAPVLETMALAQEPLRLVGLDPLSEAGVRDLGLQVSEADRAAASERFVRLMAEPGALLVSSGFLARQGVAVGDTLRLAVGSHARRAFVLDALPEEVDGLEVPDNLALADLATAQELTGRDDVTRIDLVVDTSERSLRDILTEVRARLPVGTEIRAPGGSVRYLETMMSALRLNLGALSYLALFVSLFLIYNALLLAVLRRRPHLGVVRCLGATRGEVLGAWVIEAAVIATIGTALGLLLGLGAGRMALQGIAQTASDLYGYVRADTLELLPSTFFKAIAVGLLATLAAAAWPVSEAANTPPAHTASRGDVESAAQARLRRAPWLALGLLVVALVSLLVPTRSPVPGYVAAVGLALAVAASTPMAGSWILARVRTLLAVTLGEVAALAAQNIRASLSRTGVALAALTVALSMSIAMGTMVSSFRAELRAWIADSVRADIYLSPATAEVDRLEARFDPVLVEQLRTRPGVAALDTYRGLMAKVNGSDAFTAGIDVAVFRRGSAPRLLDGSDPEIFLDRLESGWAGVSETLMRRMGIGRGDTITLEAAGRTVQVQVAGVYRDYSSDRGVVLLDRRTWTRDFGERAPNSLAMYLEPGIDVEDYVDTLKKDLSGTWAVQVQSNASLRAQADAVFTRTFVVANALEVIGIAVAAIGILAALLAMLMERRRELATLRALGLTRPQLRNLLLGESILLAALAWVFAVACGSALAWILLRVINLRSFGWMLPFHVPWADWMLNLAWSLLAAGLATVIPIVRGRRLSIASALRRE